MDDKRFYYDTLDGMRALSVVAVLIFHSNSEWLCGGFLGVEVFFVISGFIITALLMREHEKTATIDMKAFYQRRVKRLMPNMFLTVAAAFLVVLAFYPDEVKKTGEDLLPSLTYLSNWVYIGRDISYFEGMGRPRLLEHLWSLSVEFQFYLVWPILCLLFLKAGRRTGFVLSLVGAAASAFLMAYLYAPGADPTRVYFGTDARVAGFLIGCALAFLKPARQDYLVLPAKLSITTVGITALGFLIFCFAVLDQDNPRLYHGGFAYVAVLTVICLATSIWHGSGVLARLLSHRVMRWIGLRSYNIYMWHWPVFCLTQPFVDVDLDGAGLVFLRLGVTLALSELSYRFIDVPVRDGALGRICRRCSESSVGFRARMVSATTVAVVFGIVAFMLQTRYDELSASMTDAMPTEKTALVDVSPGAAPKSGEEQKSSALPAPSPAERKMEPAIEKKRAELKPPSPRGKNSPFKVEMNPTGKFIMRLSPKDVKKRKIYAIGDSVMLGAATTLQHKLGDINIDAKVGRQFAEAKKLLAQIKRNGVLGDVVIIHLGNNGPIRKEQLDEIIDMIKGVRKIYLVNDKVPRGYEKRNNELLSELTGEYKNVRVIDWHKESVGIRKYFVSDGIHLTREGILAYSKLLLGVLQGNE